MLATHLSTILCILPRRYVRFRQYATGEQIIPFGEMATGNPCADGRASLFRDLELHWSPSLPLNDHRPIAEAAGNGDISDFDGDQIATSKALKEARFADSRALRGTARPLNAEVSIEWG